MSFCLYVKKHMRRICLYVFKNSIKRHVLMSLSLNYFYIHPPKSGIILKKKRDGRK